MAEQAASEVRGPRQLDGQEQLEMEHDNLRVALTRGLETVDVEIKLRTAAVLSWFWIVRRHVTKAVEWFDLAGRWRGSLSRASISTRAS